MRKRVLTGALLSLTLALQGCGGGHHGPTEPGGPATRGNWIGTIKGTHPGLRLQGSCTLEMDLDPSYNGQWWVDCPNASSRGQVLTLTAGGITVMTLFTNVPISDCPWNAFVLTTTSTLQGDFVTDDCKGGAQSTGTIDLRRR